MKTIKIILPVVIVILFTASGCRTGRINQKEDYSVTSASAGSVVSMDSSLSESVISEQSSDTLTNQEEESGVIDIVRDSVGRPVKIEWKRKGKSTKLQNSGKITMKESVDVDTAAENTTFQSVDRGHSKKKSVEIQSTTSPGWMIVWPIILLIMIALMVWKWKGGQR